ncbi:putative fungal chitosanase [Septoria linicola]|nr:putative fungal chitosanase [Septoria linicola]
MPRRCPMRQLHRCSTGEASLALADLCFPEENLNGNKGQGGYDVMYIGFKGKHAQPGSSANWKASNAKDFEASIKDLGDSLVAQLS